MQLDDSERPTDIIERINAACANVKYDTSRTRNGDAKSIPLAPVDHPLINDSSRHFTLDEQQHDAFILVCSAILSVILNRLSVTSKERLSERDRSEIKRARDRLTALCNATTDEPPSAASSSSAAAAAASASASTEHKARMFAFVTGPAGSGKSRVIEAVNDFVRRWDCMNALCVAATSGAAAALIGARTWHSALGAFPGALITNPPSDKLRRAWSSLGVLIVDEIGMAGTRALYTIDQRLRLLKDPNRPFGGVHVIVFGDFRQLPPVGDKRLFSKFANIESHNPPPPLSPTHRVRHVSKSAAAPASAVDLKSAFVPISSDGRSHKKQPSGETVESKEKRAAARKAARAAASTDETKKSIHDTGHKLWLSLNAGVMLKQNHRALIDPEYSAALERFANNTPTAADIQLINSRLVSVSSTSVPSVSAAAATTTPVAIRLPTGTNHHSLFSASVVN